MWWRLQRLIRKTLDARSDGEALLIQTHELQREIRDSNEQIRALRQTEDDPAKVRAIDEFLADFDRAGPRLRSDDEMAAELAAFRAESEELHSNASKTRKEWFERRTERKRESVEQQKAWVEKMRKEIRKRHGHSS